MKSKINKVYHNIPQLMFSIVKAHITLCFWGRATGKTEGPGVDFTLENIITMPRSLGGLVSVSYDKLLTFIQPKLIKGWEKYGYLENVHFWVRKFAPDTLKRPKPYLSPTDPKHFIHWYNGSGCQLISLDRLGISNAADLDWIYADECRLFDYEKFVEVLNANRGNADKFGNMSQHHSILLTTDKPRDSKGQWLYDLASQADPEAVQLIMMISEKIYELNNSINRFGKKSEIDHAKKLIRNFEEELNEIRRDTIAVIEASTLDNIHALGIEPIKNFVRTLSEIVYRISILNETISAIEDGFYKYLDSNIHGYSAVNHGYLDFATLDVRNPVPDCRWYTDVDVHLPIDIALDTNAKINNVITGQGNRSMYKFVHALYYQGTFGKLLEKWNEYFKHRPDEFKVVNYFYDHTDIKGRADSALTYSEEIIMILRNMGWRVIPTYIGHQPTYKTRYMLWETILTNRDNKYPKFGYNISTCDYWYDRAIQTGTIIGKTGFEKDKRDEKKKNFDQTKAPHITDAGDTLLIGAVHLRHTGSLDFTETHIN